MIPQICVSILPRTVAEGMLLVEKAEAAGADLVEVRLDQIKSNEDLTDLARSGDKPKIATDRSKSFESPAKRQQILLNAAKTDFEYVDIELKNPQLKEIVKELKSIGAEPIISFHDHEKTMKTEGLRGILEKEKTSGAAICKIVTTVTRIEDNLELLKFTQVASANTKIVCFGMSELGKISRLLSPLFGATFTFAALELGSGTASGQMIIQEMRSAYKLLGV